MQSQLQAEFVGGFGVFSSAGIRPVPPTITYRATPVYVPEDYPTLQAAFDAEVVGKTWTLTNQPIGTSETTIASEIVVGTGTQYLSTVNQEDYLFHANQYYPVKDIISDTELRLWKGANVSFNLPGLLNVSTNVTIITSNADNSLVGDVPNGVSLQIIGSDITKQFSGGVSISILQSEFANIEIHNLSLIEGTAPIVSAKHFAVGTDRGVFRASQLLIVAPSTIGMFLPTCSAIILSNIVANKWKFNGYSDYFSATNISTQNHLDDDVMLMNVADTTNDLAYEHEVDGFVINKFDGSGENFNGGLEWNNWAATKVSNVRNSFIINKNVANIALPSYPIFSPITGIINFFDSIIDSDSATIEEVLGRGATVNFSNTTKLDGVTVPRVT